jgi:SAM-dependent methyltransferase
MKNGVSARDDQEAQRLRTFWDSRYKDFSLRESGIKSLTPRYSELLYRCKQKAYCKALNVARIDLSKPVRILDGGCGQGFFASVAHQVFQSPMYTGVDISVKAISFLQPLYPEFNWICADLCERAGLPDEKFDIAQSIEVLHLILDDRNHSEAIRNMVSTLVPNGILIITDTLPQRNDRVNEYIVFRPFPYYQNLFNELGLRVLDVCPMYYWLPDMGMTSAHLKRWFRALTPYLIYCLDRLLLRLKIPQVRQSHDSKMKMIICQKVTR